jgi:hypothetical protein
VRSRFSSESARAQRSASVSGLDELARELGPGRLLGGRRGLGGADLLAGLLAQLVALDAGGGDLLGGRGQRGPGLGERSVALGNAQPGLVAFGASARRGGERLADLALGGGAGPAATWQTAEQPLGPP